MDWFKFCMWATIGFVVCSVGIAVIYIINNDDTTEENHVVQNQEQKKEHKMKSSLTVGKLYFQHDPECQLCREQRKQEIISIVDSIISERIINSNNNE